MAITIQLTEVPENEQVPTRVFTLPKTGGSFGSAFDCLLQLPDRTGKVAAKHGCFTPIKNGLTVEAVNGQKLSINGKALASGRSIKLEDGLMIEVADYMLLVSELVDDNAQTYDEPIAVTAKQGDVHFSLDDDFDNDVDLIMAGEKKNVAAENKQQTAHFAFNGVLDDDPFDDDPFAEAELNLQQESVLFSADEQVVEAVERMADPQGSGTVDGAVESIVMQQTVVEAQTADPKVDRLMTLLESQVLSANEQQTRLQQALDKTLSTFLDEFSPVHLEESYSDFSTPLFVQKEAQYWRQYRKSFNRRLTKGEYHRLFKAILLEHMQDDSQGKRS